MDQSNRVLLISADSHASAFPETYRPYIEARYADRIDDLETEGVLYRAYTQTMSRFPEEALDIIDSEGAIRSGGAEGAFNVDRRLKEMDREGIAAEMVLPGAGHGTSLPFFSAGNEPYPADLRAAGAHRVPPVACGPDGPSRWPAHGRGQSRAVSRYGPND